MSAGDASTFTAELAGGEHAGEQAEVAVTAHSVKVKELPELDDEFAQSASEYDTLGEFRAGTRTRLESVKRLQQAAQARDRALEVLLDRLDIPLPERLVASETERREHSLDEQLERAGVTRDAYLASRELTEAGLSAEIATDARRYVKAGFVLDQIARTEELGIEQEELNAYLVEQAYRLGVPADRLAKEIVDQGQLGVAVTEVLRAKALDLLAERAAVTDEAGNPVDVKAITAEARGEAEAQADAEAGDGAEAVTEAGSGDAGAEGPDAEAEGPDGGAEGEAEAVDSGAGDAEDKPARAGTAKTGKAKAAAAKAAK
jgi:trigger factor